MGEQPQEKETFVNYWLAQLNQSGKTYDYYQAVMDEHAQGKSTPSREAAIIAFGRKNEASKEFLVAWDYLTNAGYLIVYNSDTKSYTVRRPEHS